jgi:DNA polymerase elongation subunit (family B)
MNNILINCDTDSIMIAKHDGSPWSKEEQKLFLDSLNSQFPDKIRFEHDGVFSKVIVVKSKNYILLPEGEQKCKLKGSSIKDQKKEPALREMLEKLIDALLYDRQDTLVDIYHSYIKEAMNVQDIKRWSQKKTLTESILDCKGWTESDIESKELRKNECDVWDAIKNEEGTQQGDKIYVYPLILGQKIIPGGISEKTGKPLKDKVKEINGLRLIKYWNNDHDIEKLLERIYATVCIFQSIIDINQFIDYNSKKNKHLLENFNNEILQSKKS